MDNYILDTLKSYIYNAVSAALFMEWVDNDNMSYDDFFEYRHAVIKDLEVFIDGERFDTLCESLSYHSEDD